MRTDSLDGWDIHKTFITKFAIAGVVSYDSLWALCGFTWKFWKCLSGVKQNIVCHG